MPLAVKIGSESSPTLKEKLHAVVNDKIKWNKHTRNLQKASAFFLE